MEIAAKRFVRADEGTPSHVGEASAREVPEAKGPTCLIFGCVSICRRVWPYPYDWTRLPESELLSSIENPR